MWRSNTKWVALCLFTFWGLGCFNIFLSFSLFQVPFQMPTAPSIMKVSKNCFRRWKEHMKSCPKKSKTQNQEMAQNDSSCAGASQLKNISYLISFDLNEFESVLFYCVLFYCTPDPPCSRPAAAPAWCRRPGRPCRSWWSLNTAHNHKC